MCGLTCRGDGGGAVLILESENAATFSVGSPPIYCSLDDFLPTRSKTFLV